MSDGRTIWLAKDSAWWRRERIVELGERFGPAGPSVVDWLACEAKVQNDGGQVKAGYRAVARGCFIDVNTAREVVLCASEIGALDDFAEGARTFTCRVSGWRSEQEKAHTAARMQRMRTLRNGASLVTASDATSHDVAKSDVTEQNRTKELPTALRRDKRRARDQREEQGI